MISVAFSGYPMILTCSQIPAAPVTWTFQPSTDSKVQNVVINGSVVSDYTKRFSIHGTSLIFYKVQSSDDGCYNCSDANGDTFSYNITVSGK